MLSTIWMKRCTVAGVLAVLAGSWATAAEPRMKVRRLVLREYRQPMVVSDKEDDRADERRPPGISNYWLGLECYPVDPALRSHLNLKEGEGLIIEQVVPDSPAAKAELKRHDVIVKAGDEAIESVTDLMKAVDEAGENELALEVLRGGKAVTVKVVPEKRPASRTFIRGVPDRPPQVLREWMERFGRGEPPGEFRYRIFGPGVVLPGERGLPKDLSITVTRSGNEPARLTIKRGDERWEVSEDELDKLPPDIRAHAERMLGRPGLPVPGMPLGSAPLGVRPEPRRPDGPAEKQLQEMMDQLDRLRRQMEELQKSFPREKPPAGETRA